MTYKYLKALLLSSAIAYNNGSGWKLDADGKVEMKDGNPVYISGDGREMTIKADTVTNLQSEAKTHREAKEAAERTLKSFEGLDADKARRALDLVKKIDENKLIESGEVDKLRNEISSEYTKQLNEKDEKLKQLQGNIDNMKIGSVFSSSQFAREQIAVPNDMFESYFRNNFKVEDDKIVAYDKSGNRLMSKQHVGEYASPDEALQLMVESHPEKDVILKANTGSGSGSGGGGGTRGGGRVVRRSDFETMAPTQQAEIARKVGKGEMQFAD